MELWTTLYDSHIRADKGLSDSKEPPIETGVMFQTWPLLKTTSPNSQLPKVA